MVIVHIVSFFMVQHKQNIFWISKTGSEKKNRRLIIQGTKKEKEQGYILGWLTGIISMVSNALSICPDKIRFVLDKIILSMTKILSTT